MVSTTPLDLSETHFLLNIKSSREDWSPTSYQPTLFYNPCLCATFLPRQQVHTLLPPDLCTSPVYLSYLPDLPSYKFKPQSWIYTSVRMSSCGDFEVDFNTYICSIIRFKNVTILNLRPVFVGYPNMDKQCRSYSKSFPRRMYSLERPYYCQEILT